MKLISWIVELLKKKTTNTTTPEQQNEILKNTENQTDFDILISLRKDLQIVHQLVQII